MSTARHLLRSWSVFLVVVGVGEVVTRVAGSPFFPPPSVVLATAARIGLGDTLVDDVLPSLGRVLAGWLAAVVLGVALGTALGRSRRGTDYLGPLLAGFRAIPPPVGIPVFLVLFGIGTGMQVAAIVSGCLWPILLNTVDGVRTLEDGYAETARSLRTPRTHLIAVVVLPSALPKIFAGLRLSLSIAVLLMVVSELVGAVDGIGYQLLLAQRRFDFPALWAWIALLGALGHGLNSGLLAVERHVLRRRPTRSRSGSL